MSANILNPGVVIQGRYRIRSLLGQGGFGAVYLADDIRLAGRTVALKENFDNSSESQQQFQTEATVLATLHHESLPAVTDQFVEPSGRQYLVMDYIEGQDLETLVKQSGCVNEARGLAWIQQVCEALVYLHTHRPPIIHRDIKPGNIRIRSSDGRAILVDFGIAKIYDPTQKTRTGARAVSPGFSPLEQYGRGTTDARSDIYALGATLYYILTGATPPEATEIAANMKTLVGPRQWVPAISPRVEQIILRAMQTDASQRYQSTTELSSELRGLVSGSAAPSASTSGVPCPRCGRINRSFAKVCSQCGLPLGVASTPVSPPSPTPVSGQVICPSCGRANDPMAPFCLGCGNQLVQLKGGSNASPSAPAPTPRGPSVNIGGQVVEFTSTSSGAHAAPSAAPQAGAPPLVWPTPPQARTPAPPASPPAQQQQAARPQPRPAPALRPVTFGRYLRTILFIGGVFGLGAAIAFSSEVPYLNGILLTAAGIWAYLSLHKPGAALFAGVIAKWLFFAAGPFSGIDLAQWTLYLDCVILEAAFFFTRYRSENFWWILIAAIAAEVANFLGFSWFYSGMGTFNVEGLGTVVAGAIFAILLSKIFRR